MVVLSPPGRIRPWTESRSDAVRTSTASLPARSIALRWASKSPCSASTPIFGPMAVPESGLPATSLHQLAFLHFRNIQTGHSLAHLFARLEQFHGISVISGRFDNRLGASLRIGRFENA